MKVAELFEKAPAKMKKPATIKKVKSSKPVKKASSEAVGMKGAAALWKKA
ncbi:MAG: hypothetical protein ACREAU_00315 [Nitrosopumilaceae archaeon]